MILIKTFRTANKEKSIRYGFRGEFLLTILCNFSDRYLNLAITIKNNFSGPSGTGLLHVKIRFHDNFK